MKVTSTSFENQGLIPSKYTCDGQGVNPPIEISDIPEGTDSLALIVEDPDAPNGLWIHWMIWNIPAENPNILEDSIPNGVVGKNSAGMNQWHVICPPSGEHRYYFKVFALDTILDINPDTATREDFYNAMKDHIVDQAELMGVYRKVLL